MGNHILVGFAGTEIAGNNTLFTGAGNDVLIGGNKFGTAADVLGQNKFVYDGCLNNGQDQIMDFNKALDTLVGRNGAKFSDGGFNAADNLVIKVSDAASNTSTVTLVGVHDSFATLNAMHDFQYVASPIV